MREGERHKLDVMKTWGTCRVIRMDTMRNDEVRQQEDVKMRMEVGLKPFGGVYTMFNFRSLSLCENGDLTYGGEI